MVKTPPVPVSPQWGEAWTQFERAHYHQADSTLRDRRAVIDALAWWLALPENGAIMDPADVTRSDLSAYMAVQEDVRQGTGCIVLYAALRVFWRWYAGEYRDCDQCADPSLYRFHGCRKNPMYGVRRPSLSKHKSAVVPVLTPDQVDKLLAALNGRDFQSVRDRAMIMVMIDSGVRREEVRMLNVSDLDLSRRGGGTVHVRDGKNHNERRAVFGPETALALTRMLRMHPLNPGGGAEWDGPLFVNSTGGRVSPQSVGVIVARAGEAAGIEMPDGRRLHPHQLRHTWADSQYRAGTPEAVMKTLGGWKGQIPSTYGAGAAEERAISLGLQQPVLGQIRERGKRKR